MTLARSILLSVVFLAGWQVHAAEPAKQEPAGEISYYKQIRPIFQQHCQGCHQPAKAGGGFVMTTHEALLKGGDQGIPGAVPGKPEESGIFTQITPQEGKPPAMPKSKPPLIDRDVNLVKTWIAQGAKDDTPISARQVVDEEHPPSYALPPVITAIDYSPDGSLLAISGYHEVLLHKSDGSGLVARLIGLSERIQSVTFSSDGTALAVTGGSPGRFGEVQVWDLKRDTLYLAGFADRGLPLSSVLSGGPGLPRAAHLAGTGLSALPGVGEIPVGPVKSHQLRLSVPVTFDTVYGASWSPDGTKIAFGCVDNTIRAIDAKSGKQILYQGAHNDWVLDTVFSGDGNYVASVSRDRSVKLTEVTTQRFIDNVTSITPGALKGGLLTVARRPQRETKMVKPPPDDIAKKPKIYEEILIGGADGVPKVYKMHRETKRVIGDDANKVREFEAMPGRIFAAEWSPDGSRIVVGSSLDGRGEIRIYDVNDGKRVATLEGQPGAVYALAYHPDGKQVASAGFDGMIRLYDSNTGKLIKQFMPVQLATAAANTKP